MAARNPGGALLAPRISRGHFFRVTHDVLNERGTTRSLYDIRRPVLGRVSTCSTLTPRTPRVNTVEGTAVRIAYFRF